MSGKYDPVNDYRAVNGGYNEPFPPAPHAIADTLDELKKLYPTALADTEDDDLDELCGGQEQPRLHKFTTGAVRSTDADEFRYDLINPTGLARLAKRYAIGAVKYGDHNWLKGMPVHDIVNHGLRHIFLYMSGDRSEDHFGAWAWAAFAAMHSEEKWPHLNAGHLLGPGCTPPESSIMEVEL